jgi:hypothetical protein
MSSATSKEAGHQVYTDISATKVQTPKISDGVWVKYKY